MDELVNLVRLSSGIIGCKIPEINAGGCGVYASIMYKQLVELGYKPNIVIFDRDSSLDYKKETLNNVMNNNKVNSYDKRNTSFLHCCLEVGGFYFDGEAWGADIQANWGGYNVGYYTIEELDTALKVGGWNTSYDRRKNRTIKATIKQSLKQIHLN